MVRFLPFRKCAGIFLSSLYILVNESVHKAWCRTHIYNIMYVDDYVSPAKGDTTTCICSFLANIEYVCCLLAAVPQVSDLYFLCQVIYLLTNQYAKLGAVRIFIISCTLETTSHAWIAQIGKQQPLHALPKEASVCIQKAVQKCVSKQTST